MNTDTTVTRPRKVSRVFAAGLGIVFAIAGAAVTFADANETGQSSPLAHVQSSVALGSNHSCALMSTATIKCWGSNTFGQLGTGNTASSNTPIDVITLTNVTAISAGELHTCALLATGKVNCWGSREDGRLGIGGATTGSMSSPTEVSGVTDATAISAGPSHTCALIKDGSVKCWGNNAKGQLGNGAMTSSAIPVDVLTSGTAQSNPQKVSGVVAIAAGGFNLSDSKGHTCALFTTGAVKCWGDNSNFQLGQGGTSTTGTTYPAQVTGLTSGAAAIAVGESHSCALMTTGGVQCWGYNAGQLGDGTSTESSSPVTVSNVTTATAISAGEAHTCVRLSTGTVNCWGDNSRSQLGDNTQTARATPVAVNGMTTASAMSVGHFHSCAILSTSAIQCWGYNASGQLGNNSTTSSPVPVQVQNLTSGVGATTTTTSTIAPTTTATSDSSNGSGTTSPSDNTVTPGVTVTDSRIYTTAPKNVAEGSSISVLTATQTKTQQLRSTTPDVCLPTSDDIVFIDTGKCSVSVLSKKSGAILRTLRTTVIETDVVELGIGNEIATLAPIYFNNGSADLTTVARKRISSLKDRVSTAGSVMVVGHSGIMLGDTVENRALSEARAINTVKALKRAGSVGPFFSVAVGALDPAINNTDRDAQTLNRRVIIVLVP